MKCLLSLAGACLFTSLTILTAYAQPNQKVRGKVKDKVSLQGLPGATIVLLKNDSVISGVNTDMDGKFEFSSVPVGRYDIKCQYVGFLPQTKRSVEVTSAKEVILEFGLEEAVVQGEEVIIEAERPDYLSTNEFASVSARSFSVEETQRYAGAINDPGRMAMSLPGVQMGQQDNENTMVIKGNSPIGMAWRLEGIEIPNPNHFADRAASGGGISALSIYVLGESDFFTSAFPADYGNAFSGVFDMHFKKGNKENREWRIQAGMIGLDIATEGPFSKKKKGASYVANYRYSTLGILSAFGFEVVAPNVSNTFQDLSFNLHFPTKGKSEFSVFGLGGLSSQQKTFEEDESQRETFQDTRAYDFRTNVGVIGFTHRYKISNRAILYSVISLAGNEIIWSEDTLGIDGQSYDMRDEYFSYGKATISTEYNQKFSPKLLMRTGLQVTNEFHYVRSRTSVVTILGQSDPFLIQPYLAFNQKFGTKFTLNYGLHGTYYLPAAIREQSVLAGKEEFILEPRIGATFLANPKNEFSLGLGLHSRVLPYTAYHSIQAAFDPVVDDPVFFDPDFNRSLEMIRSAHATLSYDLFPAKTLHVRIEPYFQYLYNVPVAVNQQSNYSLINQDDNFFTGFMENDGTGMNYGVELTIEKYFSGQVFFIFTGSVYESQYEKDFQGSRTMFPTRYASLINSALTGGKEWTLTKGRAVELGGRVIYGGGLRYTPINEEASEATRSQVEIQDQAFASQGPAYFRMDLRAAFRKNREKYTWRLSLDIQNVTNRENVQRPVYDPWQNEIIFDPQAGLVPVLNYILDF